MKQIISIFRRTTKVLRWVSVYIVPLLLSLCVGGTIHAEITPVTGVEAGQNGSPPYMLQSIIAGDYTVSVGQLGTGISTGEAESGTVITAADDFDLDNFAARNNPPGGLVWQVTNIGGQGTWRDTNGDAPDFFIFEAGGDDNLELRAILARGTLGREVSVSKSAWGDTGLDKVGAPNAGQNIRGFAFAITDLLDAQGSPLTNDSLIEGIHVTSGTVDPSCFCAVIQGGWNHPPRVEATADRSVAWPNSRVFLEGSVEDDGLGDPNGHLFFQWSLVSGPDSVIFEPNEFVTSPAVRFPLTPGTYVLELYATDGDKESSRQVLILVPDVLVGDLNDDNGVNWLDVQLLSEEWLRTPDSPADRNADGYVNMVDYTLLAKDWRAGRPHLVINEFLASNAGTNPPDPQGDYDDWIELHNPTDVPIDARGMYLTDDLENPTRWQIRADSGVTTIIEPDGYLLIWADDDTDDSGLHASFKLDADGEEIGLYDTDGKTQIDRIVFSKQTRDVSYGREPDGSDNWATLLPTAGTSNSGSYLGVVADTKFNYDRGFYDQPFHLEITSATPDATIVYTSDASAPTQSHGQLYNAPIAIETTTVIRAMAYKPGWRQTNVDTHTYIFLEDVIHQPADVPGYPRPNSWLGGSGYAHHDYEMDPEVVNDPAYSGMIKDALLAIPTLCIAADKEDMNTFYWGNGERPCSIELIYPNEPNENTQTDCGVEPHSHNRMKRSLRLNFRTEYGATKLKSSILRSAPLNGETAAETLDKIVLRGGNNRCWARVWNPERTTYTMDQWYRDTQIAMSAIGSHGNFVHLYINGLYWGLYNPVERPDAAFAASYFGGGKDDWYSVSHGGSHGGNASRWNYLKGALKDKNMSDSANYAEIRQYLDMEKYIDYIALTWFVGMTDWPQNNWWGANRNDIPGPFMFFGWDAEWSWKTTRGHNNGWVHPDFRSNKSGGHTIAALWHSLRRNPDFMMLFADRIYKHLFNDGVLTDQNCMASYIALNDFVRDAVVAESARWGDTCEGLGHPTRTRDIDWVFAERETLGTGFMDGNAAKFLNSLRAEGYYPGINPPTFAPHGGHVAVGFELAMANPNAASIVYYTTDGSDPREPGVSEAMPAVMLVRENATKRVLVPTGPINDDWKGGQPFDNSLWIPTSGSPGGVGYETGSGYETFISLDVAGQMHGQNSTCYIRIPFYIERDTNDFKTLTLRVRYDDGFVAYVNGVEVRSVNLSTEPAWNSSADTGHSDSEAVQFEAFDISAHLDTLRRRDNMLAIHGLNSSDTSSDFLISVELAAHEDIGVGPGGGLSPSARMYDGPIVLGESTHIKARVLRGNEWSALNEAVFAVGPVAESLRITEIMYHPASTGQPDDPNTEFVELKNVGTETLNLHLVRFTEGIRLSLPSVELAPGESGVVVKDIDVFRAKYGAVPNVLGQYTGSLDNGGERLRLEDAAGQAIHDFRYRDDWYKTTDGGGFSLCVRDAANTGADDWGNPSVWGVSANIGGSPGSD